MRSFKEGVCRVLKFLKRTSFHPVMVFFRAESFCQAIFPFNIDMYSISNIIERFGGRESWLEG